MNTQSVMLKPWLAPGLAALLSLCGPGAARAAENKNPAWGLSNLIGSFNPIYDALWLVMDDPNVNQNLLYVNKDMQYDLPSYAQWESVTWRPASIFPTQRFPASLLGTDWSTTPIAGRYIQLRNLTLDRADLDAQNVEFRFYPIPPGPGTTTSLTLNNGSLTALNPPLFNVDANFTLTASGDSTLSNWGKGRVSSQTTLNVTPGSRLTFFRLGKYAGGSIATDSWFFTHPDDVATIDGSTLHLNQSFVTFGTPAVAPGEQLGKMTFQNNALLDITGEGGRLDSGNFFFLNSRLNLGSNNHLKAVDTVTLEGASVALDVSGQIDTQALVVQGAGKTTTFSLPQEYSGGMYSVTTGPLVVKTDASLILNGHGNLNVNLGFNYFNPGSGQVVINDNATLLCTRSAFTIYPTSSITINRTPNTIAGLTAQDGCTIDLSAAAGFPGKVTNHGQITAGDNGILQALDSVIIQGGSEGFVYISSGGTLAIGNFGAAPAATSSLTTNNLVELANFSTLQLTLDPTALKNGQLRAGSKLSIGQFAELHLGLVNDQVLPDGTKFTLIDYGAFVFSQHFFNGYPNGSTFVLGLNHYRINYADTPDPGYTGAITLTVANPNPLTVTVTGNGKVTSAPAGIDCGSDCTESFAPNTVVTLTATPPGGYLFIGWQGACRGGLTVCTVTMSTAQTVHAQFLRRQNPIWKRVRKYSPIP